MTEPTTPVAQPGASMIQRVQDILLRPKQTWEAIDAERASIQGLFVPYVLVLAAIAPLAAFIGGQVFGYGGFGFRFKPDLMSGLTMAVVGYVLALVGVVILALVIDALAPSFGGTKNRIQAFKVAVYASTAAWIAGIFGIMPALAVLGILGAYSLYLLYLGLPRLMKAPQEKALGYTIVVIIVAVVLQIVIGAVSGAVTGGFNRMGGVNMGGVNVAGGNTRITVPGGGVIDTAGLEQTARQMEAAAQGGSAAGAGVIAATDLQGRLPANLGNLRRVSQEANQAGVAGLGGSAASADYENGDARITLSLTDLGAMGAMAGMAASMTVNSSSERDGSYEKTSQVAGRLTTESYDTNSRSGSYGVLVANRVMVQAEGRNVDMKALKAAVDAANPGRIEAMARRN